MAEKSKKLDELLKHLIGREATYSILDRNIAKVEKIEGRIEKDMFGVYYIKKSFYPYSKVKIELGNKNAKLKVGKNYIQLTE